jgi:adenosylcobinamide kinase/adenosylcobinamide-phosphate guanylyltransferase
VLVSNEVGSGVVPAYPSGRRFRDLLGEMNQSVARVAANVLLLVAGLPLVLKGQLEVSYPSEVSSKTEVSR